MKRNAKQLSAYSLTVCDFQRYQHVAKREAHNMHRLTLKDFVLLQTNFKLRFYRFLTTFQEPRDREKRG